VRFLRATPLLVAALALVSPARAQENPIEAQVKASLKDPAKPFTMLITLKIKDGAAAKFEAAFAKAAAGTRKEKGNKAYDLSRSTKSANEYVVYERFLSLAALQEHLKADHTTALLTELPELLDGPPEVKVLVPVGE
jgi:quinol monooxygenase YgiN